ncbi:MAG TPA: hypothetical protein VFA89_08790 [Terriglobales bacterium]|nr:hypothetical protein [Terriglobales bacterium]
MYTGNLIEGLMETVERAEEHVRIEREAADLTAWSAMMQYEVRTVDQNLLGVA